MNPWHNAVRWIAIHGASQVKRMLVRGDLFFYSKRQ